MCTGSSTRHIVTFDGQNFKLMGSCSYVLFQNKEQDLEVTLHNGACSPGAAQSCMKSIEVKYDGLSVELHSDMEVRGVSVGSMAGQSGTSGEPWEGELVLAAIAAWELVFLLTRRAHPPSVGFLTIFPVLA